MPGFPGQDWARTLGGMGEGITEMVTVWPERGSHVGKTTWEVAGTMNAADFGG